MLKYAECSGTERLDPRTPFKLFEREDVVGPSSLVPQGLHYPALAERHKLTATP